MGINSVNHSGFVSSMGNTSVGGSPVDLMAYVETLLVKDYNDQMREMAIDIKQKTKLKQAYREHKIKVNNLLGKEQQDGKITLTQSEYDLLNSQPDFRWDETMNEGAGGVRDYNPSQESIASISNAQFVSVKYGSGNYLAMDESAAWHGDPHFNDADSTQVGLGHTDWDFQGVPGQTYTYLKDSNLNMTATHTAHGGGGATVVESVQISLAGPNGNSGIAYNAKQAPMLDGNPMAIGQMYSLADGGKASFNGSALTVTTKEGYTLILHDYGNYLNGEVRTGVQGVASDGLLPTGLIGDQFDADKKIIPIDGNRHLVPGLAPSLKGNGNHKVNVEQIKTELERLQMRLDGYNSETEMMQTELSTVTSQRKLAFEGLSTMLSKVYEASSSVIRNMK